MSWSWIVKTTNRAPDYWLARVQELIRQASSPPAEGEVHGDTNSSWLHLLVDEVVAGLPSGEDYDSNMRLASVLSAILGLWYSQVHWAKTFDPNRPTHDRQRAYLARLEWVAFMSRAFVDHSIAPTAFPGQSWSFPFDPEARGGDFV